MKESIEEMKAKIEKYFSKLHFVESTHTYTVEGKVIGSVSGRISNYYEPFETYKVAKRKADREGLNIEDLLKKWDDERDYACFKGHVVHLFGEHYQVDNNYLKTSKEFSKYMDAIIKFWSEIPKHIVPVFAELRMYSDEYALAGTMDILLYDTIKKGFIIADYKTNKDLFKNFRNKKLLKPFNNLLDCPLSKYKLQLSYYQLLFEQTGYKILSRKVVWLLPTGEYKIYDAEDLTEKLLIELENEK